MMLGVRIKQERLRQELKLEALAHKICSPAHLSRFENGIGKPSDDVILKLIKRLDIDLSTNEEPLPSSEYMELETQLWQAIHFRDQQAAEQLSHLIMEQLATTQYEWQAKIDLELLLLRVRFVAKDTGRLLEELAVYKEIEQNLTPLQVFRVDQMRGMALYEKGELKKGLESLEEAVGKMKHLSLDPQERADFAYVHAVTLMANGDVYEAHEQMNKAIPYFQAITAVRRVAECHIVNGVAYKNSGRLQKALDTFKLAEQICRQNGLFSLLCMLHQNMGGVYSRMEDTEQAVVHFKKAFDLKEKPLEGMYPVLALIKEHVRMREYNHAYSWLAEGKSLLPKLNAKKQEYYETHFNIFEAICGENTATTEKALLQALSVFKKRGNNPEWRDYAERLGNFYAENRKYKKAVHYLQMAFGGKGKME